LLQQTKESSKESKESKKAVVVDAEPLKTTTSAGAREYPTDLPLELVAEADLQYFVEIFNGEMCRMQAAIPAIDTLDSVCRHQLRTLLRKYPMAKLEKMARMAAESDFLNGGGQRGFKADMEWLTREANFLKVINGKYNNIPAHRRRHDVAEERRARQEALQRPNREIEEEERELRRQQRERWAQEAATPEQIREIMKEFRLPKE
jgi:putative sterol carrier protein